MKRAPLVGNPYLRVIIYFGLAILVYSAASFAYFAAAALLSPGFLKALPAEIARPGRLFEGSMIAASIPAILFTFLFWKYFDGKELGSFGLRISIRALLYFLFGAALAGAILGVTFAVNYRLDSFEITRYNFTALPGKAVLLCTYYFFFFFCYGFFEEVAFRGYIMQTLAERGKILTAAAVSTLIFSGMHAGNLSFYHGDPAMGLIFFLNLFLVGAVFCAQFITSKTLWLPVGFHVFWNFIMSTVLSVPVSALQLGGLFEVRVKAENALLSGGEFGLEGSVLVTLLLLVVLGAYFLLYFFKRKDEINSNVQGTIENGN